MQGLTGKKVLITGGASGIGAATAKRFSQEGSQVYILDRDEIAGESIKKEIPTLKDVLICDVTDFEEVEKVFAELQQGCEGIDILINNAGISIRHNFLDITPQEWHQVIQVNLNGAFYVAQQAARQMLKKGTGVILNTASTNGIMGYPYYADYNVSKAGIIALTKAMALELAPKVRVNAVCPGYVMTPMQEKEYTKEMFDELNNKLPLKRHALPAEVATLFAFLASDDAAYLTGHPYIIDGGEIIGGLASR